MLSSVELYTKSFLFLSAPRTGLACAIAGRVPHSMAAPSVVCVSPPLRSPPRGYRHGPTRPTGVALGIATSGPQTDATGRTSSGRTRDLRERSRVLGEVRWGSGRPMGSARRPSSRCRRGTPVIQISWATHICFALTPSVVAHYNRLARARPQVAVMPRGSPCTTSSVSNPYYTTGSHTMANTTVHT